MRVALSLLCGYVTVVIVGAIDYLPYSSFRALIRDLLMFPGGFIGWLIYPGGVHTGEGSPNWGDIVFWANVLIYSGLWFLIVRLVARRKGWGASSGPKA